MFAHHRQPCLSCTVLDASKVWMHLPCLCTVLLVLSILYAASDQGPGNGSASLYTTAALPCFYVMAEGTPAGKETVALLRTRKRLPV
jgi:hypothetical protein